MTTIADRIQATIHEQCFAGAKVGDTLTFTTASPEWWFCAVCMAQLPSKEQTYNQEWDTFNVSAQWLETEPCDCEPNRPMHNNGGNYHETRYRLVSKI